MENVCWMQADNFGILDQNVGTSADRCPSMDLVAATDAATSKTDEIFSQ